MDTRKPKKSKGVPKQHEDGTLYEDINKTFLKPFGEKFVRSIKLSIDQSDFWNESLNKQMVTLSKILFQSTDDSEKIIGVLKSSDSEYLRGESTYLIFEFLSDRPERCANELKIVGSLEGTWPQESAQVTLSYLMIKHGVRNILSFTADWIFDPDERIRRMLVEALRPMGVWVEHITELKSDPSVLKPIIETASRDDSLYVRKAAANNLNDISKDNPDHVLDWCSKWIEGADQNQLWTIKQGLRSLIRNNNRNALEILGYYSIPSLNAESLTSLTETLKINTLIPIIVKITNSANRGINVRLHMLMSSPGKGNNRRTKNYFISSFHISRKSEKTITKTIHFVDYNSQPRLPGIYELTLFCNGSEFKKLKFQYSG